jgi:hypothetical protein
MRKLSVKTSCPLQRNNKYLDWILVAITIALTALAASIIFIAPQR